MSSTTAAMESAAVGTTAKARPPAGGKAPDIATVIKATKSAGACSRLSVKRRVSISVERVAVAEIPMVEVAVVKVTVIEIVAIDDRSAVRDVGVVVVNHRMAMPVASPMVPAPAKSSEEADSEADSKSNPRSSQEDPRHGIPARIGDDRLAVHKPGIIGRHVDHLRIGWLDDDSVALSCYLLLFVALQVAGLVSLLTQRLNRIRHRVLLIGVCVPKG